VRSALTQKVRLNKGEKVIRGKAFSEALRGPSRIWVQAWCAAGAMPANQPMKKAADKQRLSGFFLFFLLFFFLARTKFVDGAQERTRTSTPLSAST
jgi:hypothetical protein